MQVQSLLCLTSLKSILLFLCHEHAVDFPTENKLRITEKSNLNSNREDKGKQQSDVFGYQTKNLILAFQFPPLINCCSVCKVTCTVYIRHCKFANFHKFKYAGVFNLKVCMIIKHSSMWKIILVNDFVFLIPPSLLTMLLAMLLEETTLKGGEGGGECYISQIHVNQIFWVKRQASL